MKPFLLIISILFSVTFLGQNTTQKSSWNEQLYKKHTYKNFSKFNKLHDPINIENIDYPLLHAAIFYLTNNERAKRGIKTIIWNFNLEIAAFHHSKAMAEHQFFSHDSKLKNRKETSDRAKLAGISNPFIAENIAKTPVGEADTYLSLSKKIVLQWMNSKGHKSNILNKNALELGVGLFQKKIGQFHYFFSTQNFQWYEKSNCGESKDSSPIGW